jgi:Ran GTPase-activating protein (RanGAP) involved in mRNA processing and transport
MKPHNYSITSLNLGLNDMRVNAVEGLVNMIKNNAVLRTLNIDLSPHITPLQYKAITSAIRLYNSVLEEVSFSENPLSVKSVEYISRIFDSKETNIHKMVLTNCSMKHLHMTAFAQYVLSAKHLTFLDLSGNPIGDKGAAALLKMLAGEVDPLTSKVQPPLKHLDLSSCSFTNEGTAQVLDALSKRTTLERLDLSNNVFGPDNLPAYAALARCNIPDLRLNSCKMGSKGASIFFKSLSDTSTAIAKCARFVCLSGNEIADSAADALCLLLEKNITLEALDLGFNLLTDRHSAILRQAASVSSHSTIHKKLIDLNINLVGNKCDPYMLETPGMSRAKSNFLFGIRPNSADPANHGYSHVAHTSRGHFMARKELDNHYREFLPLSPLNKIS